MNKKLNVQPLMFDVVHIWCLKMADVPIYSLSTCFRLHWKDKPVTTNYTLISYPNMIKADIKMPFVNILPFSFEL